VRFAETEHRSHNVRARQITLFPIAESECLTAALPPQVTAEQIF